MGCDEMGELGEKKVVGRWDEGEDKKREGTVIRKWGKYKRICQSKNSQKKTLIFFSNLYHWSILLGTILS